MKSKMLLISMISLLCCGSIVYADAIGPEFPSSYHYHSMEISPVIFVIIAVIIVAISCIVSVQINKKKNSGENDTIQQKEEQ